MRKVILMIIFATCFLLQAQTANEKTFTEPEMILVQGGTFQMGVDEANTTDSPMHPVTLSDFYISKFEVTQKDWVAIVGELPGNYLNAKSGDAWTVKGDNLPIVISWDDCQKFIKKINIKTKLKYRLPTEAEWEYAAKGGKNTRGYKYAGSNNLDDVGWYDSNSGNEITEVGQKQPNELGIYDMSGNVREWCKDYYDPDYYKNSPSGNPQGPEKESEHRINRGGSFSNNAYYSLVTSRSLHTQGSHAGNIGLRLVRVP